jgi:hypothetical protein
VARDVKSFCGYPSTLQCRKTEEEGEAHKYVGTQKEQVTDTKPL